MNILRSLSIRWRLWSIQLLAFLALATLVILMAVQSRDNLYLAKQEKTRHVAETAVSILQHFHQLETQGVLTRDQAQQATREQIAQLRYGDNEYFWINDLTPTMIMHPMKPELDGQNLSNLKDPSGVPVFMRAVEIARQSGAGPLDYQWARPGSDIPVSKVSYVKLFKPWGWIIGTGIYIDDVEAEFYAHLLSFGGIALVLFVLMAASLALIIRSITRPLQQTTEAMANIASGEADLTRTLSIQGRDELAELSGHFNRFIQQLRNLIQDLLQSADGVSRASQSLTTLAEQTHQQSQQQAQQIELVATAINEVTYSVQEVAKNAETAASEVNATESQAEQGQQSIDNTLQQIDQLSAKISQSVEVMRMLEAQSTQIGSVVEVIGSIAEQTNLLALNAAIEAARAGEQGRGFAVVADEVRLLAQRTQKSTAEIQDMIEKLQSNSGAAASVIEESSQAMQQTISQASRAGESLSSITLATRNLSGVNTSIASTTLQQSKAVEDINRNVTHAAGLAQQSASAAEESNMASRQLGELAGNLNRLLQHFRI